MPAADSTHEAQVSEARWHRRASLRVNAAANAVGNLALFGTVFLLTPLALETLGPEGWGVWQLVGATTAYASLLSLGLGSAVHYQVSYNLARGDFARIAICFTNVRLYLAGAALLLGLLLIAFGGPLIRSLVEPAWVGAAHSALVATVGLTAIGLPFYVFPSALAGMQRMDLQGAALLGSALFLLAAIPIGFRLGMGLQGFAILMAAGTLLPSLPAWFLAHRLLPPGSLRWTRPDALLFRELLHYSTSTVIYSVGMVVLYQTLKFIAAWRCGGAEAAGQMGLAISVVQALGVVFVPVLAALLARVGQYHGAGNSSAIGELLERALTATGLVLLPAIVFLVYDTQRIFEAWVGPQLGAAALAEITLTARLMFIGQAAYIFALPCYYTLLGVGEHRAFGVGMLCVGIANVGVGWLAAGAFPRIAVLGLCFAISMQVLVWGVAFPATRRRLPLALRGVLSRALLAPLATALPGLALLALRPRFGRPILDLLVDGVLFTLCAAPGIELARRRWLRAPLEPLASAAGAARL